MTHYNIMMSGRVIDTILASSYGNACHQAHARNYPSGFIVTQA